MNYIKILTVLCSILWLSNCGGGGSAPPLSQSRGFLMGSTPFFATATAFPDWQFENLDDRDLLSIHVDDFLGVPWEFCNANGCTNLPVAWTTKWTTLIANARATGKRMYLAVSPLKDRKRLAATVAVNGNLVPNWETPAQIDATTGCYLFDSDTATNLSKYQNAYIGYLKYVIDQLQPAYVSPAIEINIPFTLCPAQRTAWISWYTGVQTAIKTAYPNLVIFPTFQQQFMYGIETGTECNPFTTYDACFLQRLNEALAIPGDRIAFSSYPLSWKFHASSYPTNTYDLVRQQTTRPIWISETGWATVKILQSYAHTAPASSCGADLIPANIANDTEQASYLSWLLNEAQTKNFEAVIWWLNRDYLDGGIANACPCLPADSDTCKLAETFYIKGGTPTELLLRNFGNMALRNYDGTPRVSYTAWRNYLDRPYRP